MSEEPKKTTRRAFIKKTAAITAGVAVAGASGFGIWRVTGPKTFAEITALNGKYEYATILSQLAKKDPGPNPFTFVVFGDSRNNLPVASLVLSKALEEKPDFILHTGDMVRGGTLKEYMSYYLPLLEQAGDSLIVPVPGNHERGGREDFAVYRALHGGDRFSFDYGSCRFVGFNAGDRIRISSKDLAFLDQELAKPGASHKFVMFHIPPLYFEKIVASNPRRGFTWHADQLRELLERHKVDEVFMGHIHGYATTMIDSVRYTLTAGAGAPLSEQLPPEGAVFNYVVLRVKPDGIEREVVRYVNETWVRSTVE